MCLTSKKRIENFAKGKKKKKGHKKKTWINRKKESYSWP